MKFFKNTLENKKYAKMGVQMGMVLALLVFALFHLLNTLGLFSGAAHPLTKFFFIGAVIAAYEYLFYPFPPDREGHHWSLGYHVGVFLGFVIISAAVLVYSVPLALAVLGFGKAVCIGRCMRIWVEMIGQKE